MLLSTQVTSVLFLVQFNNFALTTGFYWSYNLLLKSPVLMHSWCDHATTMLYRFHNSHTKGTLKELWCLIKGVYLY